MRRPAVMERVMAENNHHRVWKWVSGVLGVLLSVSVVGLVGTIREIVELHTTQVAMGRAVEANAQWIRDWSTVLRVPERDQRQDSAIEDLSRRIRRLESPR